MKKHHTKSEWDTLMCDECGSFMKTAVAIGEKSVGEMEGLFCTEQCARVHLERHLEFNYYRKNGEHLRTVRRQLRGKHERQTIV